MFGMEVHFQVLSCCASMRGMQPRFTEATALIWGAFSTRMCIFQTRHCHCCSKTLLLQDYNREVLTSLTMPNLAINLRRLLPVDRDSLPGPHFIAGSWASLPQLLQKQGLSGSYDFVFSTDTIYSISSHQQLLGCIHEVRLFCTSNGSWYSKLPWNSLQLCNMQSLRPGGSALIGAKSYYFGVGGSMASFKKLVNESRQFECVTVAVLDDGASNMREILQLTKKNTS